METFKKESSHLRQIKELSKHISEWDLNYETLFLDINSIIYSNVSNKNKISKIKNLLNEYNEQRVA